MAMVKMNDHKTGVEMADVILDGFLIRVSGVSAA